jgi:Ala-tRNA(Pro) deacylase
MQTSNRVMKILDDFHVPYRTVTHREAFTARDVARESHVEPAEMAKVVVARDPGGHAMMAVLPAQERLDLPALETATGALPLRLATEAELKELFPDCEPGAMPPFGGAYGMPTYVDGCLRGVREIHFQPGTHDQTVTLPFSEYERLAAPITGQLCLHVRSGAA